MIHHKPEAVDAAISYCTSACAVVLGVLVDGAQFAQALLIYVGLAAAIARAVYDIRRVWRQGKRK